MKFNSISVKVFSRPIFFLKTYIFRGCTAAQNVRRRIGCSMRAFARKGERGGSRGKRKRPRRMAKEVEDRGGVQCGKQKEEKEEEICRSKMEVLTLSEAD